MATDPPADPGLAADSPTAWVPPPDDVGPEFPWEAPTEEAAPADAYLDDLDPSVANPFPWTPDDPTRAEGPGRPF